MNKEEYSTFTNQLIMELSTHENVLGLIALGSMSMQDYLPDEYSDHDFFVVVKKGSEFWYKDSIDWLPTNNKIILHFSETQHGVKVVYKEGHLLEFAIFTEEELSLAKINRYRILFEKCDLNSSLSKIKNETLFESFQNIPSKEYLVGQFLTNILVGIGRYYRGEKISGHKFVKFYALNHLLMLIQQEIRSSNLFLLDNLDCFRRVEKVYPVIGEQINESLLLDVPSCGSVFINIFEELFNSNEYDKYIQICDAIKFIIQRKG